MSDLSVDILSNITVNKAEHDRIGFDCASDTKPKSATGIHMLKRIFNRHEEVTYRRLRPVCEKHGTSVYPKIRVADVFPIEGSGLSDTDYEFCLKSHFDFVVFNTMWRPIFAVEFDGPQHQGDHLQKQRDSRKNRLCDRFGLPLLRVGHNHVVEREGVALLEYIIDLHFGEEALQPAVEEGLFAPDEEYFPWIEFPGTTKLRKVLQRRGICAPGHLLMLQDNEKRETHLWYRLGCCHWGPEHSSCKATARIEILRGWNQPQELLSAKRTAILTDCSPNLDVLGVHGWYIASEFAEFLCFQEIVGKVDASFGSPRSGSERE